MVCFRASDLLNELLANLTAVGDAVRGAAYPLYLLGRMGEGDWLAIAFVMAVTLVLCALTYLVLNRTFIGIALLRKEFGRFTSSPNYMLNCALGTVMLPIMGVLLLVKAGGLLPVVYEIAGGEAPGFLAVMLCAALCLIGSMNDMTASSVSLEGKNLWLAQSLPVTAWQLLRAKLLVQLLVTGIPMAGTSVLVLLAIRPALQEAVLLVVLPLLFVWLSAEFGLLMDLKRPNLVWTNEITVIKQRITVLLVMLAGWLYAAAIAALYFVVGADMGAAWYLLAWSVLTAALAVLLRRWLRRSGSRLLGRLA